jgi:hypothetical protein
MSNKKKEKYANILKKCYKKKGIPVKYVDKLMNSVYPNEWNDYQLSKMSKDKVDWKDWEDDYKGTNKYVPIDYNIYGIVVKLIKEGFILGGWDEGNPKYKEMGFIAFKYSKSSLNKIKKLFGKDNIIDDGNESSKIEPGKKMKEYNKKKFNMKTYKIHVDKSRDDAFSIEFDPDIIPKMHKLLGIKPTTRKRLPGALSCAKILNITTKKMNKLQEWL